MDREGEGQGDAGCCAQDWTANLEAVILLDAKGMQRCEDHLCQRGPVPASTSQHRGRGRQGLEARLRRGLRVFHACTDAATCSTLR